MELADTIVGCLLLGGGFLIFSIMNYRILFMRLKKADYVPSPAPWIGGVLGAFLVIALFGFRHALLIVLPFIIDPGSIPLMVWFIICVIKDFRSVRK